MRSITCVATALCCLATSTLTTAQLQAEDDDSRRCAFLGNCGSFTLTGSTGTAAYILGREKYIADLSSAGEDASYWYYRPFQGDASTALWAFARQRDNRGRYWVWRQDRGGWHRFESTRAWGNALDGLDAGAIPTSLGELEQIRLRVLAIEGRVDKLEQRGN